MWEIFAYAAKTGRHYLVEMINGGSYGGQVQLVTSNDDGNAAVKIDGRWLALRHIASFEAL